MKTKKQKKKLKTKNKRQETKKGQQFFRLMPATFLPAEERRGVLVVVIRHRLKVGASGLAIRLETHDASAAVLVLAVVAEGCRPLIIGVANAHRIQLPAILRGRTPPGEKKKNGRMVYA